MKTSKDLDSKLKVRRPRLAAARNAANQRLKSLPFNKFIPNMITVTAICSGLSSVRFSLAGQWEYAVMAIIIAGLLDGIDGRVARLLGSTSKFGAELDSLADFCNFGICPALTVYLYQLQHLERIGWFISLVFAICMVLRLARFNTLLPDSTLAKPSEFFIGVCAPVGAILVLLPMMIQFQLEEFNLLIPSLYGIYVLIIAFSLISPIPTFTFKNIHIPSKYVGLTMMGGGMIAVGFILNPWFIISMMCLGFIITIPYSIRAAKIQKN